MIYEIDGGTLANQGKLRYTYRIANGNAVHIDIQ